MKIREKVILLIVVVGIIPSLAISLSLFKSGMNLTVDHTKKYESIILEQAKSNLEMQLNNVSKILDQSKILYAEKGNSIETILKATGSSSDLVKNIYIGTDNKEFFIYPNLELPADYDPTSRPWYQGAMGTSGVFLTKPYRDASTNEYIITIAKKNSFTRRIVFCCWNRH